MEFEELRKEAHEMLARIPVDDKREMVAKSRWTCESNWMMALVFAAGWDEANKMNIQVGQAVGRAEMHRLMRALGCDRPKNDEELMRLITLAMETFITRDYFDYEFKMLASGQKLGIVRACYAYTKIRSINAENDYQCGCFGMRAGWYQAMGLTVKEHLGKCMKDGDEWCEIMIEDIAYP